MVFVNQSAALDDFVKLLKSRSGVWYQRISFNHDRHHLLKPSKSGFPVFWAVYKR